MPRSRSKHFVEFVKKWTVESTVRISGQSELLHLARTSSRSLWDDRAVLRSVEITAELVCPRRDEAFHNLHWQQGLELSLDCFVCGRTGRTASFRYGQEHALCSADGERPEHPAAARIAAFDVTDERERTALRVVVDYWWAPFHDAKRDQAAAALSLTPWVRLHLGYHCPQARQSGAFGIQTNMVRPARDACGHCGHPLATSEEAPAVRLLT
jgi:hypothetical protein